MSVNTLITGAPTRDAIKVGLISVGVLLLTTIHHFYGAAIYNTPWRYHVAFVSIPAALFIAGALFAGGKYPHTTLGRAALWSAVIAVAVIPFGVFGLFEGGYNHIVKDVLYFSGAPRELVLRLFPPPTYEMPDDLFFELTGVMQFFIALPAVYYAYRLLYPGGKEKHSTLHSPVGSIFMDMRVGILLPCRT